MKHLIFSIFLSIFCLNILAQNQTITLKTLLEEMTERSSLAQFPEPAYTCKQASSYSRDSKTQSSSLEDGKFKPEEGRDWGKGWFENHDFSQYIRTEENNGRKEDVMFEAEGSGAIVRFWATYGGIPDQYGGIYRVYIDGNPIPVIEMHNKNLVGEAGIVGKPFSFFAPEKAENPTWRGRNLILPIPYGESCKVTYDGEHKYEHLGGWRGHYYQINYRTYEANTKVESFTKETIQEYKEDIEVFGKKLIEDVASSTEKKDQNNIILKAGKKSSIKLKGQQAITKFNIQLEAENFEQALRSTVLSIQFDGEQTVWCPIGQFFGIGYKTGQHHTFYIASDEQGLMSSQWIMPFKKEAVVTIENFGNQDVNLAFFELEHDMYNWDDHSMYFHATWKETRKLESELRSDYNYISIKGKGVFVGDNLTLFNSFPDETGKNWWGEGDEKIYVDCEDFPSHFGTGTEDYYSYAWCRPQVFSAPNVSQPCGEGNKTPGHTSNNRYRLLDAIPFNSNFKFDMEIWHPYRSKMNYSPATFWYAFPNAKWNCTPDIDGVKQKVALKVEDVIGETQD